RQVEPLRAGQQPVQSDDFDPSVVCLLAQFGSTFERDVGDSRREREGRTLDTVVSRLLQEPARVAERPVLVELVAHRESHRQDPTKLKVKSEKLKVKRYERKKK